MSPAAQQERIQAMRKTLKLDRVAIDYDDLVQTASERQTPYSDFLEQALGAEIAMRTERTREVLARLAGFPGIKTLGGFDFGFPPASRRRRSWRWPRSALSNAPTTSCCSAPAASARHIWPSPLGHRAAMAGIKTRFITAADLS